MTGDKKSWGDAPVYSHLTINTRPPPLSRPIMPPRIEFSANVNQISFTDPVGKNNDDPDNLDGIEYGTWIQKVTGRYDYLGRSSDPKFGAWTRRIARNDRDSGNLDGVEFKCLAQQEEDGSGDASPTLWKEASSPKEQPNECYPTSNHYQHHDNRLYHTSRTQAIARSRQEMMEMVRDMPESAYELSLRDIVELPRRARPEEENSVKGKGLPGDAARREKNDQKKMEKGKKQILRSKSMDDGAFLLKMFFPISLGGRRSSGTAATGSMLPKPILTDGEKCVPERSVDDDWWKNNGYSENCRSSSTNSRGGRRRKIGGCFPFFNTNKGKTQGY